MKKQLVLLMLLVLSVSLFAQDKELGYREAGLSEISLYPEGNFFSYPSRLNQLEDKLLKTRINYSTDSDSDSNKNTATDGSENYDYSSYRVNVDGSYFFRMNDKVLGFRLEDEYKSETTEMSDDGYSTADETRKETTTDDNFSISPEIFFAMPLDTFNFGIRLDYYTEIQSPEDEFTEVVDSQLNDGKLFYDEGINSNYTDSSNYHINLVAGIDNQSDDLEWGASLQSQYEMTDYTSYYAIDSDLDGFYADKIVDQETFYMTAIAEGGQGESDMSIKREVSNLLIKLMGYGKLPISDVSDLIVSVAWSPYSTRTYESFYRYDSEDKSSYKDVTSSGLTNIDLSVAYDVKLASKWNLRAGTGLFVNKESFEYERLGSDGESYSNEKNSNNYNEQSDVTSDDQVSNNGNYSDFSYFSIPVRAEVRFTPSNNITLFSSINTSFWNRTETISVFNLTDEKVWTESTNSSGMWSSTRVAGGMDLAITENLNVLFGTRFYPLGVNNRQEDEELPSGSSEIDGILESSEDSSFYIDLNFVFRF